MKSLDIRRVTGDADNFVFLGEAGCGKSELAVNFATKLAETGEKPVHLFDLDMTKPLFRSRDLVGMLRGKGIIFHYEEQFMDAPTMVGGLRPLLRDGDCYVVLDVGGDHMGARSVGGYAPLLTEENTALYYVINPYRPWSGEISHIDMVLAQVLGVSHLPLDTLRFVANPNLGHGTTAAEVIAGWEKLAEILRPFKPPDFLCAEENTAKAISEEQAVFPIKLYISYPWS